MTETKKTPKVTVVRVETYDWNKLVETVKWMTAEDFARDFPEVATAFPGIVSGIVDSVEWTIDDIPNGQRVTTSLRTRRIFPDMLDDLPNLEMRGVLKIGRIK